MYIFKNVKKETFYQKIVIIVFFILFLSLGLSIYKDYGIHWDEYQNQYFGQRWLNYIHKTISDKHINPAKFLEYKKHDWVHGPAFEIFLSFLQKDIFKITDPRKIIFIRHLFTFFAFYLGVFFFYLLCKLHFKSWKIGLLGSLFLILSPRIFAHSFYNSVDIPFLSLYIISTYTLLKFLDNKTYLNAGLHALTCALLIDTRLIGVLVPLYTFIFLLLDLLKNKENKAKIIRIIYNLLIYLFLLTVFIIIFWPLLWKNPLLNLTEVIKRIRSVSWEWPVLYLGKYVKAVNIPWHYAIVWMLISTPLIYTFYFIIGCFAIIKSSFGRRKETFLNKRNNYIFILLFLVPLLASIIFHISLYDSWRHLFFIYPAFLIFSLTGMVFLLRHIKTMFKELQYKAASIIFIIITGIGLISPACFMIKYHPYQNVYFNILAGKDMKRIKQRFELDYWGLSYKQALEYIVKTDHSPSIKIFASNLPGEDNKNLLKVAERKRLIFVHNIKEAKYFVSNYRWHPNPFEFKHEYFSVKVGNTKIMVVYKLR